jgi:hypothetical protein
VITPSDKSVPQREDRRKKLKQGKKQGFRDADRTLLSEAVRACTEMNISMGAALALRG